jgi:hypothetical protein
MSEDLREASLMNIGKLEGNSSDVDQRSWNQLL